MLSTILCILLSASLGTLASAGFLKLAWKGYGGVILIDARHISVTIVELFLVALVYIVATGLSLAVTFCSCELLEYVLN